MTAAADAAECGAKAVSDIPLAEVAEYALRDLADHEQGLDEYARGVLDVALARIDVNRRLRGRDGRRLWLARVTSFAFPRQFATRWGEDAKPYTCFTVEIAQGVKQAVGRTVEIQMSDEDAQRLAEQILDLLKARKRSGGRW